MVQVPSETTSHTNKYQKYVFHIFYTYVSNVSTMSKTNTLQVFGLRDIYMRQKVKLVYGNLETYILPLFGGIFDLTCLKV